MPERLNSQAVLVYFRPASESRDLLVRHVTAKQEPLIGFCA